MSTTRPHIYGSLDRPLGLQTRASLSLYIYIFSEFHISPRRFQGGYRVPALAAKSEGCRTRGYRHPRSPRVDKGFDMLSSERSGPVDAWNRPRTSPQLEFEDVPDGPIAEPNTELCARLSDRASSTPRSTRDENRDASGTGYLSLCELIENGRGTRPSKHRSLPNTLLPLRPSDTIMKISPLPNPSYIPLFTTKFPNLQSFFGIFELKFLLDSKYNRTR